MQPIFRFLNQFAWFRHWNTIPCPKCGCRKFSERTTDTINGIPCEVDVICQECDEIVNFWAYGYYQGPTHRIIIKLEELPND